MRGLLGELLSSQTDVTVVDMEAGLEHLSRSGGTLRYVDELLVVTEALRPLIMNRAPASTLAQKAIEHGMRTLRNDGWVKVKAGRTTIEEVLRVTQTEEHLGLMGDKG